MRIIISIALLIIATTTIMPAFAGNVKIVTSPQKKQQSMQEECFKALADPITIKNLKNIAKLLQVNKISLLNLKYAEIGDKGLQIILPALKHNRSVRMINLSGNDLTDNGIRQLTKVLLNNSSLNRINIGSNHIGNNGAFMLADLISKNHNINNLSIYGNKISEKGMVALAEAANHSGLVKLELGSDIISDKGAGTVINILAKNHSIRSIRLSGLIKGPISVAALGNYLENNDYIECLNLSLSIIGGSSILNIVNGLKKNKSIKKLDLSMLFIDDVDALLLAHALKHNKSIQYINLSSSDIGDEGILAFGKLLKYNHTIKYINFWRSHQTKDIVEKFKAITKNIKTDATVNLGVYDPSTLIQGVTVYLGKKDPKTGLIVSIKRVRQHSNFGES